MIDAFIKSKLQEAYPDTESSWWIKGTPKEIQKKCSDEQIDRGSTEPPWHFLNTIYYHTIIDKQSTLLLNYFTEPGTENKAKAKRLAWLTKFNAIRQKYSHPQRENTTEKEYDFLLETRFWLDKSLKG